MKATVIVVHVGTLDFTLTRSLIRIPTRSPQCVAENDTIQPTELFLVLLRVELLHFVYVLA